MNKKIILPLLALTIIISSISVVSAQNQSIPSWVKTNAGWWAEGQIDDDAFIQGIQYLVNNQIIIIPNDNTNNSQKTCDEYYDEALLNILALSTITAPINIEGNSRQYDLTHYDGLGIIGVSATQELKTLQNNISEKLGNTNMKELEKCNLTQSKWDVYGYFYEELVQQLRTMKEELE